MNGRLYQSATDEDWALSGPQFWPRLDAREIVDRWIFQRPELAYRAAVRQLENMDPEKNQLIIYIYRDIRTSMDGPKYTLAGKFTHEIAGSPEDDVRRFLRGLRSILKRVMPKTPIPQGFVNLQFRFPGRASNTTLKSCTSRWL